jgi:hypothetical protein
MASARKASSELCFRKGAKAFGEWLKKIDHA